MSEFQQFIGASVHRGALKGKTFIFNTAVQSSVEDWMLHVLGVGANQYNLYHPTPEDFPCAVINPKGCEFYYLVDGNPVAYTEEER